MVISIRNKEQTKLEKEFLSCVYTGKLFRIHTYNQTRKQHIYPWGYYQSWTTETGLSTFSHRNGEKLLICAEAFYNDIALDTFALLKFIFKNIDVTLPSERYHPRYLCNYEKENEIVFPITEESIDYVTIIKAENLSEWQKYGMPLPKNCWFKKL